MTAAPRLDRIPTGDPPYDFLLVLPDSPLSTAEPTWAPALEAGWLLSLIAAPQSTWADRPAALKQVRKQMKESLALNNGYGHRVIAGVGSGAYRALDFAINGDVGAQGVIALNPPLDDALHAHLADKLTTAADRGLRAVLYAEGHHQPPCEAFAQRLSAAGVPTTFHPHTNLSDLAAVLHALKNPTPPMV